MTGSPSQSAMTIADALGGTLYDEDGQNIPTVEPYIVDDSAEPIKEDVADKLTAGLMKAGVELLQDSITIAKETRSPRAIEVSHRLLADMINLAMSIRKTKREEADPANNPDALDKKEIKMTPAAMLEMIKGAQSGNQ